MIARIGKTYSFDAAHQLPNHDGKCARPHGHTYSVTIEIQGPIKSAADAPAWVSPQPDEGMVCDYGILDRVWKETLEPRLDHRDLNESIGEVCWPTTAENIAAWIYGVASEQLAAHGVTCVAVEVSETPKTFARVEPGLELHLDRLSPPSPIPPRGAE